MASRAAILAETDQTQRTAKGNSRKQPPSSPVNVSLLPNLLGYNLRRAQIALWKDYSSTVNVGKRRPGIFSLLVLVDANPGIAQIDLAKQLLIDKASIVGLIHELQRQRWVVRKQSSTDRRRRGIFLTAVGRRALTRLRVDMLEHEARFTRLYSAEELAQLFQLLRRIHP